MFSHTVRLVVMIVMVTGYFLVEFITGHITDSLALVADSFHMLSDLIALIVALSAIRIAKRKRSSKNTFGWIRTEIVGALVNAVILLTLCFTIFTDALRRFIEPEEITDADKVLIVGGIGLVINVIGMVMFASGASGHNHSHGKLNRRPRTETTAHLVAEDRAKESDVNFRNDPLMQATLNEVIGGDHGTGRHYFVDQTINRAIDDLVANGEGSNQKKTTEPHDVQIQMPPTVEISSSDQQESNRRSKRGNMNIKGVFLHVLGDALGSLVVIASALLTKYVPVVDVNGEVTKPHWVRYIDPSLSIVIGLIITSTTVGLLKRSALILLQTVPAHLSTTELQKELLTEIPEIQSIHEFHVWQLNDDKIITSAHVKRTNLANYMSVASAMKQFFHKRGIHSTTIQIEWENGECEDLTCLLSCQDQQCAQQSCCDVNNGSTNAESSEVIQRSMANNEEEESKTPQA
ncbi:hypothetical protein ACOME3_001361 [Neoechinorhynchus agilis]